jgi:hypothetical protein
MVGSSEEDEACSGGDTEATEPGQQEHSSRLADRELKEMLLKKYSGCLSRLRSEFLKKRKKGKLPKDARSALMDWWNTHYRWPYPTVTMHASWQTRSSSIARWNGRSVTSISRRCRRRTR